MDYSPKNYKDKFDLIEELESIANEVDRIDFSNIVDDSIEGADDFAKSANKELNSTTKNLESHVSSLQQEILSDVEQDFEFKLDVYQTLVLNKVEDSELFPFDDWFAIKKETKKTLNFNYENIFKVFSNIYKVNKELGQENIANYLSSVRTEDVSESFMESCISFLNRIAPEVNKVDLFSSTSYGSFIKALNGEKVETEKDSTLFFKYSKLLVASCAGLKKDKDIPIYKLMNNFETYKKNDHWKRIEENEENKKAFVEELCKVNGSKNPFFSQKYNGSSYKKYIAQDLSIENAKDFMDKVIQEDVILAGLFIDKLTNIFDKKKQEELSINFVELMNISVYHKLNNSVEVKEEVKQKKTKI